MPLNTNHFSAILNQQSDFRPDGITPSSAASALQQSSSSMAAASYNRRRAGNACLVCRVRKTKCDNQRPVCGFCAATGGNCRYVDSDPSQLDRGSLTIIQRISQLENSLVNHIDEVFKQHSYAAAISDRLRGPPSHSPHGWPQSISETVNRGVSQDTEVFDFGSNASGAANEGQYKEATDPGGLQDDLPPSSEAISQAAEMFIESVLRWPIFSQAAPHLKASFEMPIVEVLGLSKESTIHGRGDVGKIRSTLLNLDSEVIDQLIGNFLENNHVKNPILDVDSLRRDAREFAESGPRWDGQSCLILLVCAVSRLSQVFEQESEPGPSKAEDNLSIAEAYFQASQRRIGMLYHENSLISAQCSFLTGVYLMSTMQILAAWKCFIQAATQCFVYISSRTWNDGSPERDARTLHVVESLYWSCLKTEQEMSYELSLPASCLSGMGHLHRIPSPPSNVAADNETVSSDATSILWPYSGPQISVPDQQTLEKGWFFYLAEIALKRMINNVIKRRYESKSRHGRDHGIFDMVTEFDRQIQEWYETLPHSMRFPKEAATPTRDALRFILRGHMIDISEVVRFPAIQAILGSKTLVRTDNLPPMTLRIAQEFLQNAVYRIEANREGFFHRHQGTWLMLRSCSRSALQLLGMALKCHFEAQVGGTDQQDLERKMLPPRWQDAVTSVRELLDYWADESIDVKRLRTIFVELMYIYEVSHRNHDE